MEIQTTDCDTTYNDMPSQSKQIDLDTESSSDTDIDQHQLFSDIMHNAQQVA